eukprot:CAMPEP_0170959676 /NCGR_PEP_ID=MMETSP0735-20130129/36595_1 /TAXON_ID=186038 /ORGANISM="Fragilariopsis kerguelensis, Strain L26-C5" /LENGTH=41 /DNA_ID= /DNA_START= /DNA_END= /DNA_ORIENTATION=
MTMTMMRLLVSHFNKEVLLWVELWDSVTSSHKSEASVSLLI